jgi:hypothetical protein
LIVAVPAIVFVLPVESNERQTDPELIVSVPAGALAVTRQSSAAVGVTLPAPLSTVDQLAALKFPVPARQ